MSCSRSRSTAPVLSSLEITTLGRDRLQRWTGRIDIREISVPARTADAVLEDDPPSRVNVISIDVEGHEAAVLRGLNLRRWRPEVVIIERNTRLPVSEIMGLLHHAGYEYEETTGVNDWFVPGSVSLGYRTRLLVKFYLPKVAAGIKSRAFRLYSSHTQRT